jgi:hypothetical protein
MTNMTALIDAGLATGSVLLVTPNYQTLFTKPLGQQAFVNATMELAYKKGCAFIDMRETVGTGPQQGTNGFVADGIHPTVLGHGLWAQTILRALDTGTR